jgi:hypothetical protein
MGFPLRDTATIIEPFISSDHKRRERAMGAAEDLYQAGLIFGAPDEPRGSVPIVEQATNLLQCRFSWPDAEAIAQQLDAADLLRKVA